MTLVLQLNEEKIKEYVVKGREPFFEIFWQFSEEYYPMIHWEDFGTVIIAWWLAALARFLEGSRKERLTFMDGPYEIQIEHIASSEMVSVELQGMDKTYIIPLSELLAEVIRGANAISRELQCMNLGEAQRQSLEGGIANLRAARARTNLTDTGLQ